MQKTLSSWGKCQNAILPDKVPIPPWLLSVPKETGSYLKIQAVTHKDLWMLMHKYNVISPQDLKIAQGTGPWKLQIFQSRLGAQLAR